MSEPGASVAPVVSGARDTSGVSSADPFGAASLRSRVLAGWADTPARFREDANAERDAAGAGYGDRLVVELAQNAADAAPGEVPAGATGRLLLHWTPSALIAANTGAPLTGAGVLALSTLRASAKSAGDVGPMSGGPAAAGPAPAGAVGRFGVGFAAVLAVSDAPTIGSRNVASIAWSAARTALLLHDIPVLAGDLAARGGHVPVLRLPFAGPPLDVPAGYDTVVVLPWRDAAAAEFAAGQLRAADATLLLGLPALGELRIEGLGETRTHGAGWDGADVVLDGRAWRGVRRDGDGWAVAVFAPAEGPLPPGAAPVLRAPTPTDEPLSLPAVVVASVPLEPTRRRVVRGPAADAVLRACGQALADLAGRLDDPFPLVPTGFAAGDLDAAVRAALTAALPQTPLFAGLLAAECCVVDVGPASEAVTALLADVLTGVLPARWSAPARRAAVDALDIRRLDTGAVVDLLSGLRREPAFWWRAYDALATAPDRDALSALPVPLADGRMVTGPRGALLPREELPEEVAGLPVRLVHAAAAHPLLAELGARPATASALLADPAIHAALQEESSFNPDLARAITALVRLAAAGVDTEPWLGSLLLPTADGGAEPAEELLWPGGSMAALVDPSAGLTVLDPPAWLDRQAAGLLGVSDGPVLLRWQDVPLEVDDDSVLADLDAADDWVSSLREAGASGVAVEVAAMRDLDVIGDLPGLLRVIAADPVLRAAVVDPVRVGDTRLRSYTAWWLSRQPLFGVLPTECTLGKDLLLAGLYDPAPPGLDPVLLAALGVRADLDAVLCDADGLGDLLDRLGDTDRVVTRTQIRAVYAAVASTWAGRLDRAPDPPLAVRGVLAAGEIAAVPVESAVLADAPDQVPLLLARGLAVVPAPMRCAAVLSDLLDVPVGSDFAFPEPPGGIETPLPKDLLDLAGGGPGTYRRHPDELALGAPWRLVGGVLHATTSGLPLGLAWAAGCWPRRYLLTVAVGDPQSLVRAQLEFDLED